MSEPTEPSAPAAPTAAPAGARPGIAPTGLLQKDSDRAPRPGFRAPANNKSKAQKAPKKKK